MIIENSKVNSELSKGFKKLGRPYSNAVDINKNYEPVKGIRSFLPDYFALG
ncbi:MAG: hypothetical protein IPL53_16960 [Ignavibacteria bacterium]|nr:hypothetical protein [Ignavibacteria bacterium]